MFIYFVIFLLVTMLAFVYVKGPDSVVWRGGVLLLVFLVLFLPAALRYGIGTDYFMYIDSVEEYWGTGECMMELSFEWICDLCYFIGDSPQWVIGFYAFFTYLLVLLAVRNKSFHVAVPVYVLTAYSFTYNIMRQELAVALVTLAFALFLFGHYKGMVVFSIVAVFIHSSAIVFLPLLGGGFLMARLRKGILLALIAVVAAGLYFVDISGTLMSFAQVHAKYASYSEQNGLADAANLASGMGFWLRVLITGLICTVLTLYGKDRHARLMAVFCGFSIWFSMIGLHLEIFRRFVCVTDFVLPFAVAEMFVTSASWGRWAGLAVVAGYVFIFSHDVCAEMLGKTVPNEIVPYRTIFSASGDSV